MFKLLIVLSLFAWPAPATTDTPEAAPCDCPSATNLHKTGQTSSSYTMAWDSDYAGAQFRVWYVRQADQVSSGYFYTYNASYTFTSLSAGTYTTYVQTLCGSESSGFIGAEDIVIP